MGRVRISAGRPALPCGGGIESYFLYAPPFGSVSAASSASLFIVPHHVVEQDAVDEAPVPPLNFRGGRSRGGGQT